VVVGKPYLKGIYHKFVAYVIIFDILFNFSELDLFSKYFFHELLELWDWKLDQR
jgi:hypothetical protein